MFDFLDSDFFNIGLQVFFLLFIIYDLWKYFQTKKRKYIIDIALTVVFGIWALYPFYTKYYMWPKQDRIASVNNCLNSYDKRYCSCLEDKIFKEYDLQTFKSIKQDKDIDFLEFLNKSKKDCLEAEY